MTTSYIDAQCAPGVSDSKRDTICDRIRLIPIDESFSLGGVPGGQPLVPQWSPRWTVEHVNKIMSVSPALQAIFNRLRANPGSYWNIESRSEEDGIDVTLTIGVLSMVAAETERHHVVIDRVAWVVSRYSNVMWFYEIIPERFPSAYRWIVYDRSEEATRTVIGASYIPPPLRQVATHDTHHSRRATNTLGIILWCWSEPTGELPYETVAHLANCALVIGWKDVFKRAIKPLIWETRTPDRGLQTPVKYLKEDGPDGIKKRRHEEKEVVLAHLLRSLTRLRKADGAIVDTMTKVLSEHGIEVGDMPDSFPQPSIYQLLRDIEAALVSRARTTSPGLPPPTPPPPASEPSRRANMRITTHVSHISTSSSGSNGSAPSPGRNLDTNRRDTSMTGSSSNTHKSNGYKLGHGPSSSGSNLSSPRHSNTLRPAGMSSGPLLHNMGTAARVVGAAVVSTFSGSSGRREPRPDPDPEPDPPPPGKKGGTTRYDDFVRHLLQELHEFVLDRQAVVAEDIFARRNKDIESWKARLL